MRPKVIEDNHNGTYTFRYVLPFTGYYTLMVRVNGASVLKAGTDRYSASATVMQVCSP